MNIEKAGLGRIVGWAIVLLPLLYVSTCSLISGKVSRGFDLIKEGDAESQVLRVLGSPSVREKAGEQAFPQICEQAMPVAMLRALMVREPVGARHRSLVVRAGREPQGDTQEQVAFAVTQPGIALASGPVRPHASR